VERGPAVPLTSSSCSDNAWYHRQWIVNRFEVDRDSELGLCAHFLTLDQRNFHCWAYRRFVSEAAALSVHDSPDSRSLSRQEVVRQEFEFSTAKIESNFSNYSAFHHRSVYIRDLPYADAGEVRSRVSLEIDIVENAIFTEPDDQSSWWYLHFLMNWAQQTADHPQDRPEDRDQHADQDADREAAVLWLVGTVDRLISLVRSLLDMEAHCKWAHTCLVSLVDVLRKHRHVHSRWLEQDTEDASVARLPLAEYLAMRQASLELLMHIDSMHVNRYKYLLQVR
jgi:hypothetical protein